MARTSDFISPCKGPLIQQLLSSYLVNPIFHESEVSSEVEMTFPDPSDQGNESAVSEFIKAPTGDLDFGLGEFEQNISSALPKTGLYPSNNSDHYSYSDTGLDTCSSEVIELEASENSKLSDPSGRGTAPAVSNRQPLIALISKPKSRPVVSSVWKYFKKNVAVKASTCSFCKEVVKSLNATNVKRHLKVCNRDRFDEVMKLDTPPAASRVPTITQFSFEKHYVHSHPKQALFRKALAKLASSTAIPISALQTKEFKGVVKIVDPKLRVPARKTLMTDCKAYVLESKQKIKQMLAPINKLTLSSDIWTKRGNKSSFLGVTCAFFSPELEKKVNVVLGVQKFESTMHRAVDIIREMRKVVAQYEIPPIKVFRSMTDGASNMITSHRLDSKIFCDPNEARKQLVNNYDSEDDSSEDETTGSEERPNLGVIDVDEISFQNEFEMSPAYRRLTCFIHPTLNCLKCFDEDRNVKFLISKVQEMQSQINHSHVLVEELHKSAGVGLIAFCTTRWNYVYNVMSRLRRIKSSIEYMLLKYKKFTFMLSEEYWLKIEKLVAFLQPFSEYTNMSSREKEAISSEVIVTIISIYMHLDAYDHDEFLAEPAKNIKDNLKRRFSHLFYDKPDKPLEGTFIAATLLDPRYRLVMPVSTRVLARDFLLKEYALLNPSLQSNVRPTTLSSPEASSSKTRGKFPLIEQLKERTLMENPQSESSLRKFEEELDSYLACKKFDTVSGDADVFQFWLQKRHEYNLLAQIPLDYLSVPATSAPVERVFSWGVCSPWEIATDLMAKL